ncbi:MAG: hypothetical protein ILA03_03150 [Bacteroidaceae bacterium]|nr:hypothetical protein [Bacteroidaceae bacterium]
MEKIKIHVLRTGEVRVSPYLPFGGDDCSLLKASGITTPKSFTSNSFIEEADTWRDEAHLMIHRQSDLHFYMVTKCAEIDFKR